MFVSEYQFGERFPAQGGLDVPQHVGDSVFLSWTGREHRNKQIAPCPKKNALKVGNTDEAKGLDDFPSLMTPDARNESQVHNGTVTSNIPIQRYFNSK